MNKEDLALLKKVYYWLDYYYETHILLDDDSEKEVFETLNKLHDKIEKLEQESKNE